MRAETNGWHKNGVNNPMNKYIVELIGTFFLVLTIGCTVRSEERRVGKECRL